MNSRFFQILLFLCFCVSPAVSKEVLTFNDWKTWKLDGLKISKDRLVLEKASPVGKKVQMLSDNEATATFLEIISDGANVDTIVKRNFSFSKKFQKEEILLKLKPTLNLGPGRILETSTISFSFLPFNLESKGVLFQRMFSKRGKDYGIRIELGTKWIEFSFLNLFTKQGGSTSSYSTRIPYSFQKGKWTDLALSILPNEKEIILFRNGLEISKILAEDVPNWEFLSYPEDDPGFAKIGFGFHGWMENFQITGEVFNPISSIHPYHKPEYDEPNEDSFQKFGEGISKVYSTKYSFAEITEILPKLTTPNNTSAELMVRSSLTPFSRDNETIPWMSLVDFLSASPKIYLQYYQWKIRMRSDASGLKYPELESISFKIQETFPPAPVHGFQLLKFDSYGKNICFSWASNLEDEVKDGGGYTLYFGNTPSKMFATISRIDGKKITGVPSGETLESKFNSLSACINSDVLLENALLTPKKNIAFWKPGERYYFKISAENKFFSESLGKDMRSKLSEAVSVRIPE